MKGLNISISLIVSFLVGIMVIAVIVSILTGNLTFLEEFAVSNLDLGVGGAGN